MCRDLICSSPPVKKTKLSVVIVNYVQSDLDLRPEALRTAVVKDLSDVISKLKTCRNAVEANHDQ